MINMIIDHFGNSRQLYKIHCINTLKHLFERMKNFFYEMDK